MYWIKYYHEILDDPKMAVLPDRLWRRVSELFLLAGRLDKNGELPDTNQIAWALRMPTDDLAMDLQQLIPTGIIVRTLTGWFIPNFEKRQGPASDVERKQQERKRKQNNQYYDIHDNVTNMSRNVTQNRTEQITDTEQNRTEQKTSSTDFNIFTLYQNTFGSMATQFVSQELADIEREYPQDWIIDAFKETSLRRGKSIKYTERILLEWQRNGRKNEQVPVGTTPPAKGYTRIGDD